MVARDSNGAVDDRRNLYYYLNPMCTMYNTLQ